MREEGRGGIIPESMRIKEELGFFNETLFMALQQGKMSFGDLLIYGTGGEIQEKVNRKLLLVC